MSRRLLIAALFGAVVLAGCGDSDDGDATPLEDSADDDSGDDGDDGGGSDDPLVQAIATWMSADDDLPPFDDEEAECVAVGVVDGIGADRLEELGVTEETLSSEEDIEFGGLDMTDDEVTVVIDSMEDCADLDALLAEALAEDGTFSTEEAECLVDELPDDFVRSGFEAEFAGEDITDDQDLQNSLLDALSNCDVSID